MADTKQPKVVKLTPEREVKALEVAKARHSSELSEGQRSTIRQATA
jgi:hypothetical protein